MKQVIAKKITQSRAVELTGLSILRIKVLCRQIRTNGATAIVNGDVNREPPNVVPAELKDHTDACFQVFWQMNSARGIPLALYTAEKFTIDQQLTGIDARKSSWECLYVLQHLQKQKDA